MCSNRSGGNTRLRAGANPKKSFQCPEGQITRGVPPEAMLDGVRRYARYGGYRENGNGICSASGRRFGPDRNFEILVAPGKRHEQPALCESYF